MKFAWIQIIFSLIIGFGIGITFDKFNHCHCVKSCLKSFIPGYCHRDCHGHWKDGNIKKRMLKHLNKELSLSEEQKIKVERIFQEKHKKMLALREEIRPRFEALRKSTHNELKTILNEEQQKKLDELDIKRKAMHKKWNGEFRD